MLLTVRVLETDVVLFFVFALNFMNKLQELIKSLLISMSKIF
jgi:hypothetical protein